MWTLPGEDVILKKICSYLSQVEEIVMGSNSCLVFFHLIEIIAPGLGQPLLSIQAGG